MLAASFQIQTVALGMIGEVSVFTGTAAKERKAENVDKLRIHHVNFINIYNSLVVRPNQTIAIRSHLISLSLRTTSPCIIPCT